MVPMLCAIAIRHRGVRRMCRDAGRDWPSLSKAVHAVLDLHALPGWTRFRHMRGRYRLVSLQRLLLDSVLRYPAPLSSRYSVRRMLYIESHTPPPPLPHHHAPPPARRRGSSVGSTASLRWRAGAAVEIGCSAVSLARPGAGTTKRGSVKPTLRRIEGAAATTADPHSPSVQLPSVSLGTPVPALERTAD